MANLLMPTIFRATDPNEVAQRNLLNEQSISVRQNRGIQQRKMSLEEQQFAHELLEKDRESNEKKQWQEAMEALAGGMPEIWPDLPKGLQYSLLTAVKSQDKNAVMKLMDHVLKFSTESEARGRRGELASQISPTRTQGPVEPVDNERLAGQAVFTEGGMDAYGKWAEAQKDLNPASSGDKGFTLGPGQTRYDITGNPIAEGGPKEPTPSWHPIPDKQSPSGYSYKDLNTGKMGGPAPAPRLTQEDKTLTPSQRANITLQTRKEFNNYPIVKQYHEARGQIGKMEQAIKESATAKTKVAVDQALITIFNKMMDPTSVVRESEYARTASDQALLNAIKGKWEKVASGGAGLTDVERAGIIQMARRFGAVQKAMYQDHADYYRALSEGSGLNPEHVVRPERYNTNVEALGNESPPPPAGGGGSRFKIIKVE